MFDPDSTLYATGTDRRATADADDLFELLRRPEWHVRAACRDKPQEWFFPERGESLDAAYAICASCPVMDECATAGATERFGVWAGMGYRERRRVRRARRPKAA